MFRMQHMTVHQLLFPYIMLALETALFATIHHYTWPKVYVTLMDNCMWTQCQRISTVLSMINIDSITQLSIRVCDQSMHND